jgi:hypothetical protein
MKEPEAIVRSIAKAEWAFDGIGEVKFQEVRLIERRRRSATPPTADEVTHRKRIGNGGKGFDRDGGRKPAGEQFGVDLTDEGVWSAGLEEAGEKEGCRALPAAGTAGGAEQTAERGPERGRQGGKEGEWSPGGDGELEFASSAFGPGAAEGANRLLRGGSEPHGGIDKDVVEATVEVEVEREDMGVLMAGLERRARLIATG